MSRTIVECLIPAVPCAECEERDCCRDERRVEMLRARVGELERERDEWKTVAGRRLGELARAEASLTAAESRASAAVEAHSVLLSRIAADGTLDTMERASAAEQRAKRMEEALDLVSDFADHSYHCAQKASLSAACDCGLDEMWAIVRATLAESGAPAPSDDCSGEPCGECHCAKGHKMDCSQAGRRPRAEAAAEMRQLLDEIERIVVKKKGGGQ